MSKPRIVFSTKIKSETEYEAVTLVKKLFPQKHVVCTGKKYNGWWIVEVLDEQRKEG